MYYLFINPIELIIEMIYMIIYRLTRQPVLCIFEIGLIVNDMFLKIEWIDKIASEYGKRMEYSYIDNLEYNNRKYEFNCFVF